MASNNLGTGQQKADEIDFAVDTPVRGTSQEGQDLTAQGLKEQARKTGEQAKDAAANAVDQAAAGVQQVKEQVGQQAAEAARALREKGESYLADHKSRAASTLEDFGKAIHDAGSRLEQENDDAIASYVHGAADQVRVLAGYLKDKPVASVLSDACDLARRKPEYFVGGMFVAGLAIARFAKSGAAKSSRQDGATHLPSGRLSSTSGYPGTSDPYSTGPRSLSSGRPSASGQHFNSPSAVPFTGTASGLTGSTADTSRSPASGQQKPLGL